MPQVKDPSALAAGSFVYSGTELDAMAEARNYCLWIMRYFTPYLGRRVVEIGAGTGTISDLLLKQKNTSELVLFEAANNLVPHLHRRFGNSNVHVHCGPFDVSLLSGPTDSVVLVNVLEHILDDGTLLSQIYESLRPGGSLLLFVPALAWNYGSLDKAFGHYRRYSRQGVKERARESKFPRGAHTLRQRNGRRVLVLCREDTAPNNAETCTGALV